MKTIFMDMFEYPVLNVWEEIMRKEGYALKVHSRVCETFSVK